MDANSIKTLETLINSTASLRTKAGLPFACLTADLFKTIMIFKEEEDENGEPIKTQKLEPYEMLGTTAEVAQVVERVMTGKGIEARPIPAHIRAKMEAEGKKPSLGAADLLLMVAVASTTDVVVAINVPASFCLLDQTKFAIFGKMIYEHACNDTRWVQIYTQAAVNPFVAKDETLKQCFQLLRSFKIYVDADEEDTPLPYSINDDF